MNQSADFDVAIVGAGPVGLAVAAWLATAWGEKANRIALFDASSLESTAKDSRILALSEATRLQLTRLGFPVNATPIHHIHVSEQARFGQVRMKAQDLGLRALGWTVRYGDLVGSLSESLAKTGVSIFRSTRVKPAQACGGGGNSPQVLELEEGSPLTAHLRVDAEGGLYGTVSERDQVVDYHQCALVSELTLNVEPSLFFGNNTLAFERFTCEGPLALLPVSNNRRQYSLVWCAAPDQVNRRLSCTETEFSAELRQQFGRRIEVEQIGLRKSFALGMNRRNTLVQGHRVFIGNAAQILHPVAGQGLNLGLRDAMQLCRSIGPECIADRSRLLFSLNEFERLRVADRQMVAKMTDWMVKGFSSHNLFLGMGRQMALNIMELTPPLRKLFAELMLFGCSHAQ